MIDIELKEQLEKMNRNLVSILHKSEGLWRAFIKGLLTGFGSIIGIAIALIIFGWVLNTIGVIPAFREQAREWQKSLDEIKRVR